MIVNLKPMPDRTPVPMKLDLIREGRVLPGDNHPAAIMAMQWARSLEDSDIRGARAIMIDRATNGDDMATKCLATLERLLSGEPAPDRYVLALCWVLRSMVEDGLWQPR